MIRTQKMIDKSKKEIELYLTEILSSSTDSIDLFKEKMDIHKTVIYSLMDIEIDDSNELTYEEIQKMLNGLRKIKGESSVYLIQKKIDILIEDVIFNGDINSRRN